MKYFVGETMVLTVAGLIAIENMKLGEKVIARNLATFEIVQKTALETCVRNTTVTKTTFERLFYVKDEDFVEARKLQVGDRLVDSRGNALVVGEKKLEITDEHVNVMFKVYNFKVDNFHTYHVGENRVLVHNANKYVKGTSKTGQGIDNNAKDFEKSLVKLPLGKRVATVRSKAEEVAKNAGLVKDSKLSKINGRDMYKDPKTGDLYSVDTQHGRFEKTNSKGKHLGEFDFDFKPTKPADTSGRHNLKVK